MYSNWDLFERYFVEHYGKDWDQKRRGHTGECDYCSGRHTTETSRELSQTATPTGRVPSCARKKKRRG